MLLDDPLSAVDAHVGKYLFENCVMGALRKKTRILVTHALHFVPSADYIIVMRDGRIAEQGTFSELMAIPDGLFKEDFNQYGGTEEHSSDEDDGALDIVNFNETAQFSTQSLLPPEPGSTIPRRKMSVKESRLTLSIPDMPVAGSLQRHSRRASIVTIDTDTAENVPVQGAKVAAIMVAEEREEGSVSMSVYKGYGRMLGGMTHPQSLKSYFLMVPYQVRNIII